MNCPRCSKEIEDGATECRACGIVIRKYLGRQAAAPPAGDAAISRGSTRHGIRALDFLLPTPQEVSAVGLAARAFLLLLLFIWGWKLFLMPLSGYGINNSFMHLINLPFHEAGHIIFGPFGRLLASLGGTIGQMIVPLICAVILLVKTRDAFGAAVASWWLGENFLDIAPYIDDARSLIMPLLGGNTGDNAPYGFHDWEFILSELGLISYDHTIALLAKSAGGLVMLAACVWAAAALLKGYRALKSVS